MFPLKMQKFDRYCRRALISTAAALLLAGCEGPPPATGLAGETEYLRACATCHGSSGEGRAPTFPPLAGSEWLALGPDATALIVIHGLKGEIEVAGTTYRGYMPPMNQVSDADVAAILGYIGQRWAEGWVDADDALRIAQLRAHGNDQPIINGRADLETRLEALPPRPGP
jgi:mono/diheme cytochrome c family protein